MQFLEHSIFSSQKEDTIHVTPQDWIIDSGAIDHMVYTTTITSIKHVTVKLPNGGESVMVTHIGTVRLSADLALENVLCVPYFTFNLISISK